MKKILFILSLFCFSLALESQNNYLAYPKFWNLYNGGYTATSGLPALKKEKADQAKWKATMKLNTYKVINNFVGKKLYFITETSGDRIARLAPSFYIIKDQKEYTVWWSDKKQTDPEKITRTYVSFVADQDGLIAGALDIPDPEKAFYYCQPPNGAAPYLITTGTPINSEDIRKGLRTDWQHDIPGAYDISATEHFPGRYGEVIFTRFYLGLQPLQEVLLTDRDGWLGKLSKKEQEILAGQFGLNLIFAQDNLRENQYAAGAEKIAEIKNYYEKNKGSFSDSYYYSRANFLPSGDNPLSWQNVAKDQTTEITVNNGKYIVSKKLNPNSWFITKVGEINDAAALRKMRGPIRLSAEFTAEEFKSGYFDWQTAYIDVVQKNAQGKEISAQALRLPGKPKETVNCTGIFENEFIISDRAVAIEIFLKIAGCPTGADDKPGATLEKLTVSKILLAKNSDKLNLNELFASAPAVPLDIKNEDDKEFLFYKSAGLGLFVGTRSFVLDKITHRIDFELDTADSYSGFYSNIFDIKKMTEIELAALFDGVLTKHGNVPDWATTTIELTYFDSDGQQIYPADYGAERYQKISYARESGEQTAKSFFSVPQERGARYAQIKIHFLRAFFDDKENKAEGYYTGKASASFLTARPALVLSNNKNFAADPAFYKHINGLPIGWSVKGVKVEETLATGRRIVVFENTQDNWSSLKAEYNVPDKATALRGYIDPNIKNIKTGLGSWEGFGLFLEADVMDQQGNVFHYTGIPVYQKIDDKFVRLERIPIEQSGLIEYYVPLQHEHLRITKLLWQLALYGKGQVELRPLGSEPNADIIRLEFLTDGAFVNNPALWAQYGLYSADNTGFTFQKNYELKINEQSYNYAFAETLEEHLRGALAKEISVEEIKNIPLDTEKQFGEITIKALPSYARVEKELSIESDMRYLLTSFKLASPDQKAKYNFKIYLLDKDGNTLEIPILKRSGLGVWQRISADKDIFDLNDNKVEFIIPVRKKDFAAAAVRLVFGSNQGEIRFSDLKITSLKSLPVQLTADLTRDEYSFGLGAAKGRLLYEQKPLTNVSLYQLTPADLGTFDDRELETIDTRVFEPAININDHPKLKTIDTTIRNAIKSGQAFCRNGQWFYAENQPFTPVGFTIVGETFNKWYEKRGQEFTNNERNLYWAKYLDSEDQAKLKKTGSREEFVELFIKSQTKLWQNAGINIVRVHQLQTTWSGLDKEKLNLTYRLLKNIQAAGFLIDLDLLPNPDFTNTYFEKIYNKRYATDLTNNTDLFKAVLVLPEVKNDYVLPAIEQITGDLQKINFWPNSISYCNETGFTHGFWTIDRANPQHHEYFSRAYHFYYERFIKELGNYPELTSFMKDGQELVGRHVQVVKAKELLAEIELLTGMLKQRQRVKDNSAYAYYNLLRDEVINSYPLFQHEWQTLKNDGFKPLAELPANLEYYQRLSERLKALEKMTSGFQKKLAEVEQANVTALEKLCRNEETASKLNLLYASIAKAELPDTYEPATSINFEYIDTFERLSDSQLKQTFFTSFVLPLGFQQELNAYLAKQGKNCSIGLNNDFTKDAQALLANAYLFLNDQDQELRFNKYTHHPVGGHNMLLHSGYGNIFDEDSAVAYNLKLFTLLSTKYPARLSETNFTYAGGDNSGEGPWTILDWLRLTGTGDQVLLFHLGRNNIDNPLISDYFDIGNRIFKLNALNLAAVAALVKINDQKFPAPSFKKNLFKHIIFAQNNKLSAIAGTAAEQGFDFGNEYLKFKNTGQRSKVDCTITKLELNDAAYVMLFGIDRNNRQENRPGNPDLVQSFGSTPIVFQKFYGILSIKTEKPAKSIFAITPSGEKYRLSSAAYGNLNGYLIIDTTKTHKKAVAYKINY